MLASVWARFRGKAVAVFLFLVALIAVFVAGGVDGGMSGAATGEEWKAAGSLGESRRDGGNVSALSGTARGFE